MPNDAAGGEQDPLESRFKNMSMEVNRKIETSNQKIESRLAELSQTLMQAIQPRSAPTPAPETEPDPVENPAAYKQHVVETAKREARKVVESVSASENRKNQTLVKLTNDFPELRDLNHDFSKRAVEIFNGLSMDDQADPRSYELAVQRAALEKGIRPASMRSSDDESFTLSGAGGSPRTRKRSAQDESFDAALAFAAALGRPVDDPKYQASLKGYSERTDYNRYRQPKGGK